MNTRVSTVTGSTPFSVMFNREVNHFMDYSSIEHDESAAAAEWKQRHQQVIDIIYPAIAERERIKSDNMAQQFNARNKIYDQPFPPGAIVMVRDPTRGSKHNPAYLGPFTVQRQLPNGPYVLQDATGALFPRNVPVDHLKLLSHATMNADDVHEVDAIINHKRHRNSYQYLVKWKNPDLPTSWEPQTNFFQLEMIRDYWRRRNEPMPTSKSQARHRA